MPINALKNQLAGLNGGTDVDNPITVKPIESFIFSVKDSVSQGVVPWNAINAVVLKAKKYVILDLCDCIAAGNMIEGKSSVSLSLGINTIKDNMYIKSIILPSTLKTIGNDAFFLCKSLTSITIPNSVTSIGEGAFQACSGLTSITISDSVTSIGWGAFHNCTSLTSITIPDSVTSIGWGAFHSCTSLTCITIPDSVTSIERSVFFGCTSLTSITIPDSVTSIGRSVFSGCVNLTSITVDDANTMYSSENGVLFDENKTRLMRYPSGKIETVYVIPDSVTSIGDDAFSGCSGLTSITVPDSVTSIGDDAFWGCSGLTSITIPDSVTSIGDDALSFGDDVLKNLYTTNGAGTYTRALGQDNWTKL